ncbi:hypothetical protein IU470_27755 [Nocardia abscessus]|uniref:Uncharacterized protein n=1 Tax=Nocardia abscessus TaxID=120957 RepID=A0ABS0CG84_9NOCA|nr:hypothetical protein [Nocardia abscessus]MBF6228875.1 hypothetical protein [Nocardia abscessus]
MPQPSAVLARVREAGALRADATDEDVVNSVWALSLLGETTGSPSWRRGLETVLDGLRNRGGTAATGRIRGVVHVPGGTGRSEGDRPPPVGS